MPVLVNEDDHFQFSEADNHNPQNAAVV